MKVKILEIIYRVSKTVLTPMLKKYGHKSFTTNVMIISEIALKRPIFDCQMCGQCTLHLSGMVCPMGCPKNLRNGPCGGVRQDESCEINPDMKCVWVKAWENSKAMRTFSKEIYNIQPALDRSLQGTSAWINEVQN